MYKYIYICIESIYIYIYIYKYKWRERGERERETMGETMKDIWIWIDVWFGLVWFGGFYGISTFVGYLTPNPFFCK